MPFDDFDPNSFAVEDDEFDPGTFRVPDFEDPMGLNMSSLDLVNYYDLLKDEKPEILQVIAQYLGVPATARDIGSALETRDPCKNDLTPMGLGVRTVPLIIRDGGYCFDASWIVQQIEKNQLVNPYTQRPYSVTTLEDVKSFVQNTTLLRQSLSSIGSTVNIRQIQTLKIKAALSTAGVPEKRQDLFIRTLFDKTPQQWNLLNADLFSQSDLFALQYSTLSLEERQNMAINQIIAHLGNMASQRTKVPAVLNGLM